MNIKQARVVSITLIIISILFLILTLTIFNGIQYFEEWAQLPYKFASLITLIISVGMAGIGIYIWKGDYKK